MRYFCLACDFDGTLAQDGRVNPSTLSALERVAQSGRKLVLVTGRALDDLTHIFPQLGIFHRVVAENGALLYTPASRAEKSLAEPPPQKFLNELQQRGVPFSLGRSIVATWHPHETAVMEVIREMGLELHLLFNKGAVMVLPSTVNKASGLREALDELGLSKHNVVGVGDAENDHAFISWCECGVAVANALPELKRRVDFVTQSDHGAGAEELMAMLLEDDLHQLEPRLARHRILLGQTASGAPCSIEAYGSRLLVAGPSGAGKSTTVAALMERLHEKEYQICLIDPEGDYDDFEYFVTLGGPNRVPAASEILEVLDRPKSSLSINLLGVRVPDRPAYFLGIWPRIQELRARTGRPHWLVIDESHHLLPAGLDAAQFTIPKELGCVALITVHPRQVHPALLSGLNAVISIGPDPAAIVMELNDATQLHLDTKRLPHETFAQGTVVVWPFAWAHPETVSVEPAKAELRRHRRKYATGELGADRAFYFRGPDGKLNLKAQNFVLFAQTARGVDDETWLFHLRRGDYSKWLRDGVKDNGVAEEVARVEQQPELAPAESRARILEIIEKHYTAPQ
jgi:hydroxymethylpyrimidine pyrophosphatase-like HAD family hydrolase/energy-coupling factor transporter ATP-binding protein EcfA2